MRRLVVPPGEILTDEFGIPDETKLAEYYLKISEGRLVNPITLMLPEQYSIEEFIADIKKNVLGMREERINWALFYAEKFKETLDYHLRRGGRYLLCDGNHRGVAYALYNRDVPSEIMETDEDLNRLNKRFTRKGKHSGPAIMGRSKTLKEFFLRAFRSLSHNEKRMITLERKVECLQREGEIRIEDGNLIYTPPKLPF